MKRAALFMLVIFCLANGLSAQEIIASEVKDGDERMQKIFAQGAVLNAGIDYSRKFEFDRAIEKMLEATQDQYLLSENDKAYPLERLADLYRELGLCENALGTLKWHKENLKHPRSQMAISEQMNYLNACIAWQKTGDKKEVYLFIEQYKREHVYDIPPKRADNLVMSRIAEFYDLIGDYDAGIAWVIRFKKKVWWDADKKTKTEYNNLIQAFEESKQGMPKVCSEDGKYCVGRATAVIIRSGYF